MLPKPSAILFDWDGTIVDTMPLINAAQNAMAMAYGMPAIDIKQSRDLTSYDAPTVARKIVGEGNEEAALEIFWNFFISKHLDFLSGKQDGYRGLEPQAGTFVDMVQNIGIPLGIVSNKRPDILRKEISHIGWDGHFKAIVGAGDAPHNKPHPAPALLALETLGIHPSQSVWFVGDTYGDITAAKAAGITAILVGNNDYSGPEPDFRFANIRELETAAAQHFRMVA